MTAQLIDGKLIAQQVRESVAAEMAKRTAAGTTVVIGERPDSIAYV